MENRALAVDIAGDEDVGITALHGIGVVNRDAPRIELDAGIFQGQPIQVRHATQAGQYLVDHHTVLAVADTELLAFRFDLDRFSEMDGEVPLHDLQRHAGYLGIGGAADGLRQIEAGHLDPEAA